MSDHADTIRRRKWKQHRVRTEAQTWHNVPPYESKTLYRARCTCGWEGLWRSYEADVPTECIYAVKS